MHALEAIFFFRSQFVDNKPIHTNIFFSFLERWTPQAHSHDNRSKKKKWGMKSPLAGKAQLDVEEENQDRKRHAISISTIALKRRTLSNRET